MAVTAQLYRYDDDDRKDRCIDENVLDHCDHGRRAQSARVGVGREDHEGDQQR